MRIEYHKHCVGVGALPFSFSANFIKKLSPNAFFVQIQNHNLIWRKIIHCSRLTKNNKKTRLLQFKQLFYNLLNRKCIFPKTSRYYHRKVSSTYLLPFGNISTQFLLSNYSTTVQSFCKSQIFMCESSFFKMHAKRIEKVFPRYEYFEWRNEIL